MDGKKRSGLITVSGADKKLMKKLLAVLIFGFGVAFNSLSAPIIQSPSFSPEQSGNLSKAVQKEVSDGQERVFDVSYEIVTNKLSALKISPEAAKGYSFAGRELAPGQYYFALPESLNNDVTGKNTDILVTKIDSKNARVQMKTINMGLLFNTRDRWLEKQRLNELSQLLSN